MNWIFINTAVYANVGGSARQTDNNEYREKMTIQPVRNMHVFS